MNTEPIFAPLAGTVVHGRGKGHLAGMPTANLRVETGALPPGGVYASVAVIDGRKYLGVTNIGPRPSADDESDITVETFLLDFSGDLYGRRMILCPKAYLRPTRKMASLAEVKAQVDADCARARQIFTRL